VNEPERRDECPLDDSLTAQKYSLNSRRHDHFLGQILGPQVMSGRFGSLQGALHTPRDIRQVEKLFST
jgi:hypothetical protein